MRGIEGIKEAEIDLDGTKVLVAVASGTGNATKLIDDHVLDSFDIIKIVNELNEAYDIEINVMDLEPENFNTVSAIHELIEKLLDE